MDVSTSRKFAVVLHADVSGSTNLVQLSETLAHKRIREAFRRLSEAVVAYGGTTHEVRGDALVAEFPRPSDAVCAALRFQEANTEANSKLDDGIVPVIRVGIAVGEEVFADDTVTGTGVVLAQRVEQLSDPGGICVTGAVQEAIPHRMPFEWESLGEKEVKGFETRVHVYRVVLKQGHIVPEPESVRFARLPLSSKRKLAAFSAMLILLVASIGIVWLQPWLPEQTSDAIRKTEFPSTNQPTLAVLPFENLSGHEEQRYFADGLSDDLITDLSKVSGLVVVARNSSFAYRGMPGGIEQVANELGVRYLLDGSVRRAGEKVRINAQLVDSSTGQHVWSDRYDQELNNIFLIQDQVTKKIVSALKVNLTAIEQERFDQKRTANFDAYDMLLRAREIQARFTPEDNATGRELYAKAAQLDPNYARAYAGVALTHAIDVNMNWTSSREHSIRLGLDAVNLAFELDDTLPLAHFARGALYLSQRRYEESIDVMQRAVEIAPNYADGHANLAFSLINAGLHNDGLQAIDRAKRLNPRYSQVYLYVQAIALFHLERFDEAASILQESIERNPAFDRPQVLLAATLGHLGSLEDAEWVIQEARVLLPDLSLKKEKRDSILSRDEDVERYIEGLRRAGLTD